MTRFPDAKGFIFDCDGTLLDSLDAWEEAERDLFAKTGPLTQGQEDEIHSAPIEKAAEIFHERYGVGESSEAVLAHLDGYLLPFYGQRSQPMPGACELVRMIHEQGIPCIVLSSSPRRYLDAGLKHVGIRDCFIELVTTDEVGVSKQDPAIYQHALEVLGCDDPGAVYAVDDAPYAIAVMSAFGLKTIGVAAGCSQERKKALEGYADIVVETLCDLLPS
ncbi:MAG: HAD family phosphatase [Eggerthellaceae bacterium]|nr:HAD family phosphatase [Eggerthellaceae bacterium]